jgi:NADH-quinone oxidoreductase subunit E
MNEVRTSPLDPASAEELATVQFDDAMEHEIELTLDQYPDTRAALLPVLWLCQQRWGWISSTVMRAVAERLHLPPADVEGVVSFYTMFQRHPPGRFIVQACSTLSCQLCGAAAIIDHLRRRLRVDFGETSADGNFTLVDVQCLGACGEAPVLQINDDYYSVTTTDELDRILDRLTAS